MNIDILQHQLPIPNTSFLFIEVLMIMSRSPTMNPAIEETVNSITSKYAEKGLSYFAIENQDAIKYV